jgi:hypothetical protein
VRLEKTITLTVLLLAAVPGARASITGVCPDGSIFVVQQPEAIPCSGAKQVEPGDVPPLKPEMLPRPYAWEVFNQQQNPNNPYNVIDAAKQVREARSAPVAPPAPEAQGSSVASAPRAESRPQPAPQAAPPPAAGAGPIDLGLSEQELRDLALIVELSQQRAPASFRRGDEGAPALELRVAPSASFEARLRDAFAKRGRELAGPVLLFTVRAAAAASFHPNFAFVQNHQAFHPDPEDPAQLGWLRGDAGELAPEAELLGYVVLPAEIQLAQPLEIYWDDHRVTATLRP